MEDSHYVLCWTCWRENQGYKRIKSDDRYDALQQVIHQLLQDTPDTQHLDNQIKTLHDQVHQLKMEISNIRYQAQNKPKLDQALIKRLLMFCHPDRNQGRPDEAGELTKTLLALRGEKKWNYLLMKSSPINTQGVKNETDYWTRAPVIMGQ